MEDAPLTPSTESALANAQDGSRARGAGYKAKQRVFRFLFCFILFFVISLK